MDKFIIDIIQQAGLLSAELWLLVVAIFVLLFDIFNKKESNYLNNSIAIIGVFINYYLIYNTSQQYPASDNTVLYFSNSLAIYKYTYFIQYLFNTSALLSLCLGMYGKYNKKLRSGEYLSLMIFMLIGLHLLAKPANFLILYLSIELISFSAYILTYFNFNKWSSEGSLKYLLFGAFSTACMLYGVSLFYAFTGSISLNNLQQMVTQIGQVPSFVIIGLILIGLLFKLAAFPFQGWAPDVYQAAPTPFVAFLSVAPKIGVVFIILLIFQKIGSSQSNTVFLQYLLGFFTLGSILFGNLGALWQKNAKRLLAYSSIAHTGFLLIPLFNQTTTNTDALLFYASIFLIMNTAAFAWVYFMEIRLKSDKIDALNGCGKVQPFVSVLLLIIMISLTGLPITAGFTAKLFVFSELWVVVDATNTIASLVFIAGLLNVLIALYYYLQFPYTAFFKNPPVTSLPFALNMRQAGFLTFVTVPLILFFFKPDWLMTLIAVLS